MMLIDERTPDGSRHFARWPATATWREIRNHILSLPNAKTVNVIGEEIAAGWIDFTFRGHRFVIHHQDGNTRLIVRDPQCSDLILYQVGRHFERLLAPCYESSADTE